MTIPLKRENEFCEITEVCKSTSDCMQIGTLGGADGVKFMKLPEEYIQ